MGAFMTLQMAAGGVCTELMLISASVRLMDRRVGGAILEWARDVLDPYRPELHYMRGPGPKWREKHIRVGRSDEGRC